MGFRETIDQISHQKNKHPETPFWFGNIDQVVSSSYNAQAGVPTEKVSPPKMRGRTIESTEHTHTG